MGFSRINKSNVSGGSPYPEYWQQGRQGRRSLSTNSTAITLTPQARRTFQESFAKFEKTVVKRSKDDRRDFADTTLRDVWEAVMEIEQQLAARQCLRNLKRIEPFLNGLEAYSKVVEVLCNGTPFMLWIWAPIKLMMKVLASDHISAFETLISAYAQIAENLPRFDRLTIFWSFIDNLTNSSGNLESSAGQNTYVEELTATEGCKSFFNSSWGQFDSGFSSIPTNMQRHASLVDKEANAYSIAEVMIWRKEAREAAVKVEKERSAAKLAETLSWLGIDQIPGCDQSYQDNTLNRLSDDCCAGTTDWTSRHPRTKAWLQDGRGPLFLWLKGKPGSGKSTIVAVATLRPSFTKNKRTNGTVVIAGSISRFIYRSTWYTTFMASLGSEFPKNKGSTHRIFAIFR
ncbi:hypothetical protein PTT_18969 [Pyrenophora teres f. teres 0-1]|uniref:Nephrocystin 3-like N-terminal domain-containing protein n=1 Tax=Pyrenophora teres f. teres (strain 0-1) TaxID=861557 RepID=E3S7W9_PYRTT|nr:hypothetical protein PTT_18969 [Pyrenophora teres f. teres 0-1]